MGARCRTRAPSPAITDLLGGHVQLAALSIASGMPHIKGGKVRGLAVTSPTRSPALPDVPTVAESGFPGFEATGWLGILVPNGTPPAVIARLNAEIAKVMQNPEVQKKMVAQGVEARWHAVAGVRRDDRSAKARSGTRSCATRGSSPSDGTRAGAAD